MIKPFRYILLSLLLLLPGAGTMQAQTFDRGDVNGDGIITVADIQALANYLRTGNFNIVARTLSFADNTTAVNKTYGDAAFTVAATPNKGADDGDITYTSSVTGVATVNETTGQVTIVAAGTTVITANISAGTTYGEASAQYTLTVSQAAISPTVTLADFTYGSTGTPSVSGNSGSGAVTYYYKTGDADWTTTQPTAAGTHQVKAQIAATANYLAGETDPVSFTISQKEVTVSGITASDKTYDGTTDATLVYTNVAFSGIVGGDALTVSATGTFSDANAGSGKTVTISGLTLGGSSVANYTLAAEGHQSETTATITAASATITASASQSVTYSGSAQALTASTDNGSVMITYYTDADHTQGATATAPTNAGTYYAIVTQTNSNYMSAPVNVTYTINQLEAELAWSNTDLTYTGLAQLPTCTVSNLQGSDACTVTVTGGQTNVGNYTATATALSNLNYTLPSSKTQSFTISAVAANVTTAPAAVSGTLTYTGSAQTLVTTGAASGGTLKYYVSTSNTAPTTSASGWTTTASTGTNAGTYYVWYYVEADANHTSTAVTAISGSSKAISKAAGSVTLSSSSISFSSSDAVNSTKTFTVSGNTSGGSLSVSSSNTSAVTATISGTTVTLKRISNATVSSVTITVTSAATDNYNSATKTCTVSLTSITPTTLAELKTWINNGNTATTYLGYYVTATGAISTSSTNAIGIVAYYASSNVDTGVSDSRILVIASADASTSATWGSYGTSRSMTDDKMCGYSYTSTLNGYGSSAHPAAYAAWNYNASRPSGASNWFLPTKAQLTAIVSALGGYSTFKTKVGWASAYYWSSTESNAYNAYLLYSNGSWSNGSKNTSFYVRSCFAY